MGEKIVEMNQEGVERAHNLLPELTKDATVVILTKETKEDYKPGKVIIPEPIITIVSNQENEKD